MLAQVFNILYNICPLTPHNTRSNCVLPFCTYSINKKLVPNDITKKTYIFVYIVEFVISVYIVMLQHGGKINFD